MGRYGGDRGITQAKKVIGPFFHKKIAKTAKNKKGTILRDLRDLFVQEKNRVRLRFSPSLAISPSSPYLPIPFFCFAFMSVHARFFLCGLRVSAVKSFWLRPCRCARMIADYAIP